ncbi:hypothetical protein [Nocardioides sp. YIM 152588]|uniref:hypothetical protein n=1 Tax=Nocardioides sp. YIM 152588 TaxID=3158259 RepID=UPI0032E4FB08
MPKLRGTVDRSLVVRSGAVLAALALALAGCGALMPGGGTAVDPAATGPGVSEEAVKVVFVGVDLDAVKKTTGFKNASVGDPEQQVQALEDWVNANGGLGGRELDAVFKLYDASTDSPAAEEQLCNEVTQDERAFAVVLTGQFQSNARPCYAGRETLMLDETLVANNAELFEELAPYLWAPSFPEYNSFVASFVQALDGAGFFEGRDQVAIVAADTPSNRATIEGKAIPQLDALGMTAEVGWVDPTDIGTIYTGEEQAAITFATKGIDRVMFLGGSRLASIFATIAGSKGFDATYAISSFDNPSFFVNNPDTVPADTMTGMVGVGFHPPQDVFDDQYPFPTAGVEQECIDIYAGAGIEFGSREAARVALPYCDAARLLKLGADNVDGELNAATWSDAVNEHGDEYQTASGFGNALGGGHYAAAGAYRVMRFDDACSCFVYEGDDVPFVEE